MIEKIDPGFSRLDERGIENVEWFQELVVIHPLIPTLEIPLAILPTLSIYNLISAAI